MGKHDSSPTLSWTFVAKFYKWFSGIVIFILIIIGVTVYAISYSLERNCNEPYLRNVSVGDRWLSLQIGSNESGCPANPNEDAE